MPHYSEYKCRGPGSCGRHTERELLTVKKVVFTVMGAGGKVLKSRTVAWLCDECVEKDPEYTSEPYANAPGLKSPALERVRAAEEKLS